MDALNCMVQRIVQAEPPLMDKIDAAFNVRGKHGVIYSWGEIVYNPSGTDISPALRVHESVHGARQVAYVDPSDGERGISAWWQRYIADPKFRLDEEIPAHCGEYRWHLAQPNAMKPFAGWRARHQFHKHHIALRLASPLYGSLITLGEAKRLISE